MADDTNDSNKNSSDDPDTVLRELKKQAEYGKLFAATLTKDAAAIEGAVKELNKNRDDIDKNEKAYTAGDFLKKFADLRSRVDDKWPCLRRVLEDRADLADLVIRTYREDILQARAKLEEITEDLTAAQRELASRTRELADKQETLNSLMNLPAALATQLTTLTALDKKVQDASQDPLRAFEAYATADEIIRQFEEELFIPTTDEFHKLVFARWGDVVRTQRALAKAQNRVSTLTGEQSTAKQTVDDLTKDRIAELLRRWTAALLRAATQSSDEEVPEWATSTSP
jgi:DNA repair exonuclease SbcCD ATPase subunit